MIKRPLVWVLGGYVTGMLLAWYHCRSAAVILFMAAAFFFIYLLFFKLPKKLVNRYDSFLWFLPVFLLLGFLTMAGRMEEPELSRVFEQQATCKLTGTITKIVQKQWGRVVYTTNNTVYLPERKPYLCENIMISCSDKANYRIGNEITVYGDIVKFSEATNPGQFNEKLYYQVQNVNYKVKADQIYITNYDYSIFRDFLYQIKQKLIRVYEVLLSEKEAGAIIAMLLGESCYLNEEIDTLYQQNGISHILSISGLHVSLLGMAVYKLLKRLKLPFTTAIVLSILFLYSYGLLTNFSVSTKRAVMMMVLMLLSGIFGKTYDMLSAISLSAFLILLANPMQLFHVGFLLSFGAVFGIAVFLPCFQLLIPSKNPIVTGLLVSLSVQVSTLPLLLFFFYQIPRYSIIINLIILPLSSLLLLTAFAAGILGCIFLPFGIFFVGAANYILKFYEWVCRIGAGLPGNMWTVGRPDSMRIFLYAILLLFFVWSIYHKKQKRFFLILPVAFLILVFPQRNAGLEITLLDVGQGEAIFMETETGITYFVDGGSTDVKKVGKYRMEPYLLYQGVDHIAYAFLSHMDSDHKNGLMELMTEDKIKIDHLILTQVQEDEDAYEELEALAAEKGTLIQYIKAGDQMQDGKLQITCLHPSADYQPRSSNSTSMVLGITYGEFDLLLTGDLEKDGEDRVLTYLQKQDTSSAPLPPAAMDYDILKVAHHGSKNATQDTFLKIIQPEIALISCGKDNRYGHPHKELLERLEKAECKIKITYESGAITITTDGNQMKLRGYCD
ncbi:MAG TPA: DNA internalization-related competence protein ComEC/Rec2 [Lachnospiraceae bacterium]|nr:DNA internalization-related competence protein ComEC/Rec2 [Lachnospiraceae bacterium]